MPVGATMLMILAGANLAGRPATRDTAAAESAAGDGAAGDAGRDGLLAVPVALAAADLLAAYTGHAHANFVEGAAILLVSGVLAHLTIRLVEDPLRLPQNRQAAPRRPRDPLAGAAAPADDRAGIGGRRCSASR